MGYSKSVFGVLLVLGMATPIAYTQDSESAIIDQDCSDALEICVARKREEFAKRGTLGLLIHPSRDSGAGQFQYYRVAGIVPNGVAETAGVREDDIIVDWNGETFSRSEPEALYRRLQAVRIGEEVSIGIRRNGEEHVVVVKSAKPDDNTIEYWLLFYVERNFSEEKFQEYASKVQVRLKEVPDE